VELTMPVRSPLTPLLRRAVLGTALLTVAGAAGCTQDHDFVSLVGGDGPVRFNLQFTNEVEVDLDLHVLTPGGEEIYWQEKADSTGGELDVDCFCTECAQGPNENIFWPYSSFPPAGEYEFWVEFYGSCDPFATPSSDYTLRVVEGGLTVETFTGTMDLFSAPTYRTHTVTDPTAAR